MAVVAAAVLVALAGTRLGAQERSLPAVGERVRIVAPAVGPRALTGDLMAVRGDTLFVRGDQAVTAVAVPLSRVEWIEVRRRRSRVAGLGRGLLIGIPVGAASGYLLGAAAEGGAGECSEDCGLLKAVGTAAGLVTGTVLGAVIGVTTPGGHWVQGHRPDRGVALSIGIKL
ncbi:MAG TPA: hypothetical protein VGO40_14615 [Longimicrobium sp.]|nr:hypothetical protein [Longimicrobium sp.]